jgi:2-methylcitrate dehydratase PrpD
VALALARSDPSVDDFVEGVEDGVDDEVRRLIDLTDVRTAEWIDQAYPQKWISTVAVETDAKTHKRTVEFPRGEPENPLSWEELVGKFDDLVEPILGARAATRVREAVADVESRSVRDLTAPVVKAAGGNQQPATSD